MNNYKNVLITGGCGAIGSGVLNYLKKMYPHIFFINLDNLTYAANPKNIENQDNKYLLIKGNICDIDFVKEIFLKYKPECIIHLAAETHVDNSFGNSLVFTHTNILGTHVLLECCRYYMEIYPNNLKLFLHMSTDEVYGSVQDNEDAKIENSLCLPSNPYSATKAGAEMLCQAYLKSFKIPIIITRCNNAISKFQHEEKLIPRTISLFLQNKKMTIHGNGSSKRTFIHVNDIASALNLIINKGTIGKIYNIGSHIEKSVIEVVKFILNIMKPGEILDEWIEFVEDRAFQDYRYYINTTELNNLGWKENISFENAVNEIIKYINLHK
jgi:dTDP-glucose 4,6-dehydratase